MWCHHCRTILPMETMKQVALNQGGGLCLLQEERVKHHLQGPLDHGPGLGGVHLMIRRAVVKYYNAGETTAQHTDRSVRSLVKLFNVDEGGWMEDMERIRKICEDTGLDLSVQPTPPAKPQRDPMGSTCKSCCFAFHATLCAHTTRQGSGSTHLTRGTPCPLLTSTPEKRCWPTSLRALEMIT